MEREPTEGNTYTHERTFSPEEVRRFGELSGDRQPIHTEPDEEGRLVVQGLLTATIPTKIGATSSSWPAAWSLGSESRSTPASASPVS